MRLKEEFVLRQLLVLSQEPCELKIEIGNRTVLARTVSSLLGGLSIAPWPASVSPLFVPFHTPLQITIFPRGEASELPNVFECLLRGGAKRVFS
jgi:hypothetical protein